MQSSNGSRKSELYEHLFKSIKAGLGIDVAREEEDPVKAFLEGKYPGQFPMIEIVRMYLAANGDKEKFLKWYPQELREFLWDLCDEGHRKRMAEQTRDAGELQGKR